GQHRAAHPGVGAVGLVGALLMDGRAVGRVGVVEFVPADAGDTGAAAGGVDGVVDHERLIAAEVAIGQPIHEAVVNRFQVGGRVRLVNALVTGGGADGVVPGRDCDGEGAGEGSGR